MTRNARIYLRLTPEGKAAFQRAADECCVPLAQYVNICAAVGMRKLAGPPLMVEQSRPQGDDK